MPKYIDQEALLKDIEDSVVFTAKSGQPSLEIRGANKITARIMAAPAVDVVEVRHGFWEDQLDGTHYCSECGHDATYTYDGTEICGVSCPFCGAKMEGKGEE